jgi:hypothetical protein
MSASSMKNDGFAPKGGESDPLLDRQGASTATGRTDLFRRSRAVHVKSSSRPLLLKGDARSSVRLPADFSLRSAAADGGDDDDDERNKHQQVKPVDALAPLVAGGVIVDTDGYRTESRPPSTIKSLPAFAPFRRMARHRSFYLWWLNEFRHWWKSSRLLVRLAGLFTLAFTLEFLDRMQSIDPYVVATRHSRNANAKNTRAATKIIKKLGQGGPMSFFLDYVTIFTRTLRAIVACWRWIESAQCRRREVGVEETMVRTMKDCTCVSAASADFAEVLLLLLTYSLVARLLLAIESLVWWLAMSSIYLSCTLPCLPRGFYSRRFFLPTGGIPSRFLSLWVSFALARHLPPVFKVLAWAAS